ncbi:hypothetical protein ACLKA7_015296 [Drosophila subpalustris]
MQPTWHKKVNFSVICLPPSSLEWSVSQLNFALFLLLWGQLKLSLCFKGSDKLFNNAQTKKLLNWEVVSSFGSFPASSLLALFSLVPLSPHLGALKSQHFSMYHSFRCSDYKSYTPTSALEKCAAFTPIQRVQREQEHNGGCFCSIADAVWLHRR